jgi:translation initiation factor 2B subunit (eIF-2B alpha/beta/delta family)
MTEAEFAAALDAIRQDRRRGASELARAALAILAESAERLPATDGTALAAALERRAAALAAARPSMTAPAVLIRRWLGALGDGDDPADLRRRATDGARGLIALSERAVERAAENAAALVPVGATIATQSLSATVTALLARLAGRGVSVIIAESRPLCEGAVLAERLSDLGMSAVYVTDAALGHALGDADLAVVGADTILADGGVVNKAGTYPLALAARDRGIPFLVVAESFKRRPPDLGPVDLEAMDPAELGVPGWPGIVVRNVYFDITPARLVGRVVTEED